jgi:hypothetical protein
MALAYFSGIRERQRLSSLQLSVGAAATIFDDENEEGLPSMSEENAELRHSKLFWLNAGLTIALMTGLVMEITQCPRASWQSGKPAPTRDRAIPVGAGLPAMDSSAPRLSRSRVIVDEHRWQASSYKGPRNTCRSRLAGDGLKCAAFIQVTRVIVDDHCWQASSYKGRAIPVGAGLQAMDSSAPRLSR